MSLLNAVIKVSFLFSALCIASDDNSSRIIYFNLNLDDVGFTSREFTNPNSPFFLDYFFDEDIKEKYDKIVKLKKKAETENDATQSDQSSIKPIPKIYRTSITDLKKKDIQFIIKNQSTSNSFKLKIEYEIVREELKKIIERDIDPDYTGGNTSNFATEYSKNESPTLLLMNYFSISKETKSENGSAKFVAGNGLSQSQADLLNAVFHTNGDKIKGSFNYLLDQNDSFELSHEILEDLHNMGAARTELLVIKASFFNRPGTPSSPEAYFIWKGGDTLEDSLDMALGFQFRFSKNPFFKDTPSFTPTGIFSKLKRDALETLEVQSLVGDLKPYDNDHTDAWPMQGSLDLTGNLGTYAQARVSLLYTNKNFGDNNSENDVRARLFQMDVVDVLDAQWRFGRYRMVAPSDGISMDLFGDGLDWSGRTWMVGHLVKRESRDGTPNPANQDDKIFFGNYVWRPSPKKPSTLEFITFHGLYGKNQLDKATYVATNDLDTNSPYLKPSDPLGQEAFNYIKIKEDQRPFSYITFGADASFSFRLGKSGKSSMSTITANLGVYYNQSKARNGLDSVELVDKDGKSIKDDDGNTISLSRPDFLEQQGYAALLKLNYFLVSENNVSKTQSNLRHQIGFSLGYGSGGFDREKDRSKAYVGETQSFEPDQLFISKIAPVLSQIDPNIGAGLSNKTYGSLSYTCPGFSILGVFTYLGQKKEPIRNASTTFTFNYYRLNTLSPDQNVLYSADTNLPVATTRKNLGWEFDFSTDVSVFKGVENRLSIAYFNPGSGLEHLLSKDIWRAELSTSIQF